MLNTMQVIAEEGGRKSWSYLSNFACCAWKFWSSPAVFWYLLLKLSQLHIFIFDITRLTENIAVSLIISTVPPLPSSQDYKNLAQDYKIHLFGMWVFCLSSSYWISLTLWSSYASVALPASADRAADNWTSTVGLFLVDCIIYAKCISWSTSFMAVWWRQNANRSVLFGGGWWVGKSSIKFKFLVGGVCWALNWKLSSSVVCKFHGFALFFITHIIDETLE